MTDRYSGFCVVLEKDLRDDDAQSTIEAIRHIKGVLSVEPKINHTFERITTRTRLISEISNGFYEMMKNLDKDK